MVRLPISLTFAHFLRNEVLLPTNVESISVRANLWPNSTMDEIPSSSAIFLQTKIPILAFHNPHVLFDFSEGDDDHKVVIKMKDGTVNNIKISNTAEKIFNDLIFATKAVDKRTNFIGWASDLNPSQLSKLNGESSDEAIV